MCLAVPARIEQRTDEEGWVQLGETRLRVNLLMTPEARVGDWVLVHAGFAIHQISEDDARETWQILESIDVGGAA